jgi:hypothetical protein
MVNQRLKMGALVSFVRGVGLSADVALYAWAVLAPSGWSWLVMTGRAEFFGRSLPAIASLAMNALADADAYQNSPK